MDSAARSGKQNIVEGSIEELIGDLEDFLRQRGKTQYPIDNPRVIKWREQSSRLIRNLSNLRILEEQNSLSNPGYLKRLFELTSLEE